MKKTFFKELKGEFKKIIWPNRKSLVKQTTTVVVVSLIMGLFIAGIDSILSVGLSLLIN